MKITAGTLPLLTLTLALATAASAQSSSSLEVTVNTGAALSSAATRGISAPAPTSSKQEKQATSKTSTPAPNRGALASRAGRPQEPQAAPMTVTVRPGKVVFDSVAIRTARAATSKMLSTAIRGQTLAILSEMDDLYGVLMVNNTIGWVDKSAVQLLDYNTEVTLEAPKEQPRSAASGLAERGGLDEKQRQVLREAFSYMGAPYVWAGNSRSGLDCSAFVKNVFSTVGVSLPRHSGDQITQGRKITDTGELVAGDRLYFAMKGGATITHTGIYIGEGFFIHASSNHKCVDVDPLFKTYVNKLVAIRRD
nr:C40 family peptidase [Armatimonas sp.]